VDASEGIENMDVFVKRPWMASQRPEEVSTHAPAGQALDNNEGIIYKPIFK